MKYSDTIIRDPGICGGEPVIKGTRVTLRTLLSSLAEGATIQEILDDFPSLEESQDSEFTALNSFHRPVQSIINEDSIAA